ncbi:HelD family protein [Litchfieldia alkalitelluris]|uniref:HelD family protein n=1 Tax=Litchfieldia alkalitelluris TaxID=304268 RepID=UPI000998811C|nr:UvrD-helicase domain-containing protein [Litchfieldia alkalitelluris]
MNSTRNILSEEQKQLSKTIKIIEKMIEENKKEDQRKRNDPDLPGNLLTSKRIKEYEAARKELYFGRVDIIENGKIETCYLGEVPIAKDDTEILIYNWKSPIGDAFGGFYGGDGTISYEVEDKMGRYQNTLTVLLKRQMSIKDDKVIDYSDVLSDQALKSSKAKKIDTKSQLKTIDEDAQYADQFLANLLKETSQVHGIKKVIATIRKEQNDVIRLGINEPILIQGVAGSGKSTIALNRISFLLYRYNQSLKTDNILILAPNKMFLSYIEGVLPGLDISKIQQKTFLSLVKELIPSLGKIVEPFETLASIVNGNLSLLDIEPVTKFKGSIQFKESIDKYFSFLEDNSHLSIKELTIFDPFIQKDYTFSTEKITQEFKNYAYLPYEARRRQVYTVIENWKNATLQQCIRRLEEELTNAEEIWVKTLPSDSEIRKQTYLALEKASKYKIDTIKKEFNDSWKNYKAEKTLNTSSKINKTILEPELLQSIDPNIKAETLDLLAKNKKQKVQYEDLAALVYIETLLNGPSKSFDYIVIDEAQDLSPFQILVLKQLSKSMTILGDETQSIYYFMGIENWGEITNTVYKNEEIHKANLAVSYRSTFEVMETANQIITNGNLPYQKVIPFNRHGDNIVCRPIEDEENLLWNMTQSIKEFLGKGYKRIAIIHKDAGRSEVLFKALQNHDLTSIQLVLSPDDPIKESIVIIPSYLVKGLEFDAVIIPNANEDNYRLTDLDAKLLYVSVTRPHHALHIYYYKKITPLLKTLIPEAKKEKKEKLGIL